MNDAIENKEIVSDENLIGRYKKFSRYGIPMYVTNLSTSTDKILQMSGVYSIIPRI